MILVVDNYDSFTFNLVQALQAAGAEVTVLRNDAIDRAGLEQLADDPEADLRGIVISPGPGDPDDAGVSVDTIKVAAEREIPLLGVCLGMQSMAAAYGASIVRAPTLVHGEATEVTHDGAGLLEGMPPAFMAAGYDDRPDISIGLAEAYLRFKKAGVQAELHMYAKTGHGFGLRPERAGQSHQEWPVHLVSFLRHNGFIK